MPKFIFIREIEFPKPKFKKSYLAEWHKTQVGGTHYKGWVIPVIDFCQVNKLSAAQSSIVRYVCRYKDKNGLEDLKKIIHYLKYLIAEIQDRKMEQRPADYKFKMPIKDFCFLNNLNNVQSQIIEAVCYYNCRSTTPLSTLIKAKENTEYLIGALENEQNH